MGIPRRDGGGGSFKVNISPLVKSSPEEQGFLDLGFVPGTRIVVTGLQLWPHHDRGLHAAFRKFLVNTRPAVTILLGNVLNEEAFKQVADSQDRMRKIAANKEDRRRKIIDADKVPELRAVRREFEGYEERFLALAKKGGEFIADFADASGGHVFYIPALQASGQLPNEMGLFDFVLTQKEKLDKYAEKHPDEANEGPPIPQDFADFLGLEGHEHVSVLPFGAAIRVNDSLVFQAADYKRRQPASASQEDVLHTTESTVRLGDGKVSSVWWTTPKHSLGGAHRRWWQAHEVGNMFDLKQLGFLRNYDRRAKGFWTGTVVGDEVQGTSVAFARGKDGRRGFVVDGVPYDEDTVTSPTRMISLVGKNLPFLKTTASAQETVTQAEPKAEKPAPAKLTSKRSGTRGKKK
jgi:hypothetical protein